MSSVVIVSGARTAIGTAWKGSLANTPPEELAAIVLRASIERSGFAPERVDDVILAESLSGGGVIARYAAVRSGIIGAAGMAVNRHCAGGLSAIGAAAGAILAGMEDVIVAGGVNSSSFSPRMQQRDPATGRMRDLWIPDTHPDSPEAPNRDMSITVGWNAAKTLGLTRQELDAWALRSHERALAAIRAGNFKDEIVPVPVSDANGNAVDFETDEHPRQGGSMEKLAALPVLHPEIEGFNLTAATASGLNDAAAAMLITRETIARDENRPLLAKVLGWTAIGVDPAGTGLSVARVVNKLLARTQRTIADVALWEINEAFASVPLAACRMMNIGEDKVNVSGSGCSLGHPIAASGARMLITLAHDLKRRGGGLGIAAMCAGGGQAGAVLIEV